MSDTAAGPNNRGATSSAYGKYVLVIMCFAYFLSFVDRTIIAIALPGIREDFHLTDFEIGLIVGPAFGLVFAVLSVPLASMGDRFSRRNIIIGSVFLFSLVTLATGYAALFWQLLLARFGLGVGLAGIQPSVNSILSDVLPRAKRSTVMGIGAACGRSGGIASVLIGGWIASEYGWRTAIIAAGVPGFLLALLIIFTVREPERGKVDNRKDTGKAPPFGQVLRFLFSCPTYRNILLSSIFLLITTTSMSTFTPMLFTRGHGVDLKDASYIAAGYGVLSVIMTWLVGILTDKLCARDIRWMLYLPAALQIVILPFFPLFLLSGNLTLAIIAGAITAALGGAPLVGPLYAAIQNISPLRIRSMAMGVYLFVGGIAGAAAGPALIGKISDLFMPYVGAHASLGWSILVLAIPGLTIGAFFLWRGARSLEADIARAEATG